jgi:hypothetical protein
MVIASQYVKKAGGMGWTCTVDAANDLEGTTNPSGITFLSPGEDLIAEAFIVNATVFLWWRYDGVDEYSTDNPVTIPAEADGTHHGLIAFFRPTIGVSAPRVIPIALIHEVSIETPVELAINLVPSVSIETPVELVLATVTDIDIRATACWMLMCHQNIEDAGVVDIEGWTQVASGATQDCIATPSNANGYINPKTNGFLRDTTLVTATSVDATDAHYTVPAQTNYTCHQCRPQFVKGWTCTHGANLTLAGYNSILSGNGWTVTATGSAGAGKHWHIWVDGMDCGHSPYAMPVQADGSNHTAEAIATPN